MKRSFGRKRDVIALAKLLACTLLACCPCAFALDPALDVSQYVHSAWRNREGSLPGAITSIAQTPDGYLWLGSELGLVRFDGIKTVPWGPPPGQHLPSNDITSLIVARDGTLWIGTHKGLAGWKGGELTQYPELAGQIVGLLEDREGSVWVSQSGVPTGALCAIRNGRVQCDSTDGTFGHGAFHLYEDSKGALWVGVSRGLLQWKPHRKFYPMADDAYGPQGFIESGDGALLIGTHRGIQRVVNGKIQKYRIPGALREFNADNLLRERDGSLWIGTSDRGIVHVHQDRTDTFTQLDGLSADSVTSLFEDREGNIWVSTSSGLDRFREPAIPSLAPPVRVEMIIADRTPIDVLGGSSKNLHLPPRTRDVVIEYTTLSLGAPERVRFRYKLENRDRDWQDAGNRRYAVYGELPPGNYRFRLTAANESGVWNEEGTFLDFTVDPAYDQTAWFRVAVVAVVLTLTAGLYRRRVRRLAEKFEMRRVEKEVADARAFQQSLLPPSRAEVAGVSIFAEYIPCSELAGDFYDYASTGPDTILLVADVSGHGATAAMLTGIVKAAFHSARAENYEPASVVQRVFSGIRTFAPHLFITLICVRLRKDFIDYVNAGHPPGVVCTPHTCAAVLEPTGPIVSPAFTDLEWEQRTLPIQTESRVVLFTDGIIEVGSDSGEYGMERLLAQIRNYAGDGNDLAHQIIASIRQFAGGRPIRDDLTIVVADLIKTPLDSRLEAVQTLESSLVN